MAQCLAMLAPGVFESAEEATAYVNGLPEREDNMPLQEQLAGVGALVANYVVPGDCKRSMPRSWSSGAKKWLSGRVY